MADLKEMLVGMIDNACKTEGLVLTKEINTVANLVESEFRKEKKEETLVEKKEEKKEEKEQYCKHCKNVPTIIIEHDTTTLDMMYSDVKLILVVLCLLLIVLFMWKFSEHIKTGMQIILTMSMMAVLTDPSAYGQFFPQLN